MYIHIIKGRAGGPAAQRPRPPLRLRGAAERPRGVLTLII